MRKGSKKKVWWLLLPVVAIVGFLFYRKQESEEFMPVAPLDRNPIKGRGANYGRRPSDPVKPSELRDDLLVWKHRKDVVIEPVKPSPVIELKGKTPSQIINIKKGLTTLEQKRQIALNQRNFLQSNKV